MDKNMTVMKLYVCSSSSSLIFGLTTPPHTPLKGQVKIKIRIQQFSRSFRWLHSLHWQKGSGVSDLLSKNNFILYFQLYPYVAYCQGHFSCLPRGLFMAEKALEKQQRYILFPNAFASAVERIQHILEEIADILRFPKWYDT